MLLGRRLISLKLKIDQSDIEAFKLIFITLKNLPIPSISFPFQGQLVRLDYVQHKTFFPIIIKYK